MCRRRHGQVDHLRCYRLPMRILLVGASGVLGQAFLPHARAHTVLGLTRSADKVEALRALGVAAKVCDVYEPGRARTDCHRIPAGPRGQLPDRFGGRSRTSQHAHPRRGRPDSSRRGAGCGRARAGGRERRLRSAGRGGRSGRRARTGRPRLRPGGDRAALRAPLGPRHLGRVRRRSRLGPHRRRRPPRRRGPVRRRTGDVPDRRHRRAPIA